MPISYIQVVLIQVVLNQAVLRQTVPVQVALVGQINNYYSQNIKDNIKKFKYDK